MPLHLLVDDGTGSDLGARERTGQMLLNELRRARVPIEPTNVPVAPGSKAGAVSSMGELIVTGALTGTSITAMATVVVAFVRRGSARSLTMVDGDRRIEIHGGVAKEDQRVALEAFLKASVQAGAANQPPDAPTAARGAVS